MNVASFVIETRDPKLLESTLKGLPMIDAEAGDDFDGQKVTVLVTGNVNFAEHAIRSQGYGNILERTDHV